MVDHHDTCHGTNPTFRNMDDPAQSGVLLTGWLDAPEVGICRTFTCLPFRLPENNERPQKRSIQMEIERFANLE